MNISGIYKIQSVINPKRFYIGSSEHVERRWNKHKRDLIRNKHHSPQLQYHYDKYGESDLIFIIIEPCLPEFLTVREQYYLDTLKPYFNTCSIAGNTTGYHHTKETIEKFKGRIPWNKDTHGLYSEEYKEKLREKRKTFRHTEETKARMRKSRKGHIGYNKGMPAWNKGLKMSEDSCEKMSKARKGKSPANKGKKLINGRFIDKNAA